MDQVDAVVIGAGVVGLAVGRALAMRGLETVVLERCNAIGTVTSSRNSEVIHAGLYYATNSLKARLCVQGRKQLYAYCEARGIEHRRCGKLLVATREDQLPKLAQIAAQARANGVLDLRRLDAARLRALEPELVALEGLLSPSTGIIDSHGLMLALQGDLEAAGGAVALLSPARALHCGAAMHVVDVGGDAPMELASRVVVNAAGLWAPLLAAATRGLRAELVPQARYAKGNYFSLTWKRRAAPSFHAPPRGGGRREVAALGASSNRAPFSHLIYPVPEPGGLGVHLTLDLAGQARFGPDVEWISPASPDDIDYRVDPARGESFYAAIRRYWPALPDGALQSDYSGVRPKLQPGADAEQDFVLQGPAEHGVAGLMNLYGIESPGLTACLGLAEEVVNRLGV